MPSIVPGFEYDIFISYRHKDNRKPINFSSSGHDSTGTGWVTDFALHLGKELESTFKEDINIYLDTNAQDGLLESHDVDKSLEGKLKAVIFIPILSQIYCDPKCFAWQNEFCAFNRMALTDDIGRDIKLRNGNVASRILPITIHQLDYDDVTMIENELKSKLRPIDFIFRSPGVNRPLMPDDSRQSSTNNLFYRDQINKVANAIKEIINAIKYPDKAFDPINVSEQTEESVRIERIKSKSENQLLEKSLAVLPFANLSHDQSQEYFADGITENILIKLASLPALRVISRTSVMRYKKTTKSTPEIATELGVKYILEGSAQAHGNKVRINVQLIDGLRDQHIWSKVFVESLDDIFDIQNNVAEVVASELKSSINTSQNEKLKEIPTKNLEAYDLFLKGRHAFNQWGVNGYRAATEYYKKAIEKDHDFRQAYSALASSYSARMSWNGDLSPEEAEKNIQLYLDEAWKRGPSDDDYLTKAFVQFFIKKDFQAAEKLLLQAIELAPNNSSILYTYSYLLNMMGRFEEATRFVEKAKLIDPLTVAYFNYQFICFYLLGRYDEAIGIIKEALQLYPAVLRLYDYLARTYLTLSRYDDTIATVQSGLRTSNLRPPSMIAYLSAAYANSGEIEKTQSLVNELVQRSNAGEKGVNIYLVHAYHAMNNNTSAWQYYQKAKKTNDVDLIWWDVDPLLKKLKDDPIAATIAQPDFVGAENHIKSLLHEKMPNLQYHNISHIYDVLESAMIIAENEKLTDEEIKLLRIAALFHDVGFIQSSANHEEKGAAMAAEILFEYGFDEHQIRKIQNMIMATRIPQSPVDKLEKILCDADLDYLGRDDFYEIGGRLFEELKAHRIIETEREWNLVQKTFLESHRYHTEYSKAHRERFKKQRLNEIVDKLRMRA